MAASRSSYINLYAKEDKSNNAYKAQLEVSEADVAWEGAQDLNASVARIEEGGQERARTEMVSRSEVASEGEGGGHGGCCRCGGRRVASDR